MGAQTWSQVRQDLTRAAVQRSVNAIVDSVKTAAAAEHAAAALRRQEEQAAADVEAGKARLCGAGGGEYGAPCGGRTE